MATETEQLIVLLEGRIAGFEKAMKQAEGKGVATYQKLQDGSYKATTAIEKRMEETARAMGRSLESIFGANKEWANRGAMNAEFKAFMQSKAAVDQLRASIDPLFAASKRYEAAVIELDQALARGVLTEKEHAAALEQVGAAMLSTGDRVTTHTGALGALGNMSNATKAKIQGVGFQVQDFAVQVAGGTSATTAMAQQLPQLLGNFGLVGIAVGTLASVGLPLLGAAFGSAGDKSADFGGALSALENSVQAVNDAAARYTAEGLAALIEKYGEVDQSILTLIEHQRQFATDRAEADAVAAVSALAAQYSALAINLDAVGMAAKGPTIAIYNMSKELGLTTDQARALVKAMQDAANATTFEDRAAALSIVAGLLQESSSKASDLTEKVIQGEAAMRQLAAAAPKASWLGAALSGAQELVSKLWEGVRAKAALAGPSEGMTTGTPLFEQGYNGIGLPAGALLPEGKKGGTGSAGGGGGGGSAKIDALLADLQTEREIVAAWYAESLTTLNSATEAQLAAVGGKHEALERLEREHQERLRGIRDEASGGALANAETFFGAMATLTAAGGAKLAKVARATAAAEALINTYRAQAQVLADPKLGFWQKLPAMAAIGAAGMKLVSALGGGGGGSAKATTGAASTSTTSTSGEQAADPLLVTLKGLDPKAIYSGQAMIDLFTALQKEAGRRGMQMGFTA
jgi:hypothetical protein